MWDLQLLVSDQIPSLYDGLIGKTHSSNAGRYLATAALDGLLAVWDLSAGGSPSVVGKHELGAAVTAAQWHPAANRLLLALGNGRLATWDDVVPPQKAPPHVAVSALPPGALPPLSMLATWGGAVPPQKAPPHVAVSALPPGACPPSACLQLGADVSVYMA